MIIESNIVNGIIDSQIARGSLLILDRVRFKYPPKTGGVLSLFTYKRINAIRSANIRLDHGDILILRGPNGSGKTTLLGVIGGFMKPDEGDVLIEGKAADEFHRLSMTSLLLADRPIYFPKLKVSALLRLFSSLYGTSDEIADELGILGLQERYIHTLSRGQLQRLSYYMWLSKPAKLYLGDEVDLGIDDDGLDSLIRVILRMTEEGASFIIASPVETILTRKLSGRRGTGWEANS